MKSMQSKLRRGNQQPQSKPWLNHLHRKCRTAQHIEPCAISLTLALLISVSMTQSGSAQPFEPESSERFTPTSIGERQILFNAPPPPINQGAPRGRRDGGASRGACLNYDGLMALVPITDGIVWGQTTAAHPTLWFYSPVALHPATLIELVVQDASDNYLYTAVLDIEMEAGTMAIAIPDDAIALLPDEPYYWTFSINCDPARPASSVFVRGTIQRVDVDGLDAFSDETERSIEQAQAYAAAGIWHDALTIMGELRRGNPANPDVEIAWTELLQQTGLAQIAPQPIQTCCSPES